MRLKIPLGSQIVIRGKEGQGEGRSGIENEERETKLYFFLGAF